MTRTKTKVFDPKTNLQGMELLDATVAFRDDRWWMFIAGQSAGGGPTQLYSALLPAGSPLSATGWEIKKTEAGEAMPLCGQEHSFPWDGNGGRHCPSYVKGWDPHRQTWVERLYYAGAANSLMGPYTIGFLEWDGTRWRDQPAPAFVATGEWERGSVYEPNLLYHNDRWLLWYVAGSNQEDYLVHGFAESEDGVTGWSRPTIFAPQEMKVFDFCVREHQEAFEAVFSRISVGNLPAPPETGLWRCRAQHPFPHLASWQEATQIMNSEDCGWHSGPWKPSLQFDPALPGKSFIFFDGLYRTEEEGPFPFAFTLGCLEESA